MNKKFKITFEDGREMFIVANKYLMTEQNGSDNIVFYDMHEREITSIPFKAGSVDIEEVSSSGGNKQLLHD